MKFELFVALRYLFSRRGGQQFVSITSVISILGVALGVGALIVVMGVMTGFTVDLRDKLISVNTQMDVASRYSLTMQHNAQDMAAIKNVPGVAAVTPYIYSELILSTPGGVKGAMVRGIDPDTAPTVFVPLQSPDKLIRGDIAALKETDGLPGIIIGNSLARYWGLDIGSRLNLLTPTGQQTIAGFTPSIKAFRVVGIFSIGFGEYDTSMAYIALPAARSLLGYPENLITGYEVALHDIYQAEAVGQQVGSLLGPEFRYRTWMTVNANILAALKLEKLAMGIILTLVIIVGCFSIVTSLVMLVMEKKRDIAILLSMGATAQSIRRIFIWQGSIIGAIGTTLGYALGLLFSYLLSTYQFITLPAGVYSLNHVPVLLQWPDLILTGVGAMVLCFLAALYPARQAASLEPVSALRAE